MDINYLLFLQDFRNSINDAWTPFMEWVSFFAISNLMMIPVFVYWVVDKKRGLYVLCTYYFTIAINAVVKLTACIYRPWIRDARILPAGDAITTATGYSFPSGHTSTAMGIYGGLTVAEWKKHKIVPAICIAAILVTGFSRNYLGVHTPQDVIVAMLEGVLSLFVVYKLFKYVEECPEKENMILLIVFAVSLLAFIYVNVKPYPMDYVNGELLVDPAKMLKDGYADIGALAVFCVARFIEKKWVNFKATGINKHGIIIGVIGMIPLFFMIKYMGEFFDSMLGKNWGHFTDSLVIVFYVVLIYPTVIKLVSRKFKLNSND